MLNSVKTITLLNEPAPLSPRQAETMLFIGRYLKREHRGPTAKEISQALQVNGNASFYVDPIIDKGYLKKTPGKHRSIKLTEQGFLWLLAANQAQFSFDG